MEEVIFAFFVAYVFFPVVVEMLGIIAEAVRGFYELIFSSEE